MSGVLSQSEIDYLLNDISREVNSKKTADDSVFTEYKGNDIVYSVPEGITRIEEKAFSSCVSLETIILPSTLREIGAGAFSECKSLKNIKIPKGITKLEDSIFANCESLTNVIIPETVIEIDAFAFFHCSSLKEIEIPNSVKSINSSAFANSGLKNVKIPDSVDSFGNYIFDNCLSLEKVELSNNIKEISSSFFYSCKSLKSIEIPKSVTKIGNSAFSFCSSLENIKIPDNIVKIGEFAFKNCNILNLESPALKIKNGLGLSPDEKKLLYLANDSLENIKIPDSVIEIKDNAFFSASNLKNIEIPDSVKDIGKSAFSNCTSLEYVKISNSIEIINKSAFNHCNLLKEIEIPNSVHTIEASAFEDCFSLKKVKLPDSIKSIKTDAFFNCPIENFGSDNFEIKNGLLISKIYNSVLMFIDHSLKNIIIPENVKEIELDEYFLLEESEKNIYIPSTVSKIISTKFATDIILKVNENPSFNICVYEGTEDEFKKIEHIYKCTFENIFFNKKIDWKNRDCEIEFSKLKKIAEIKNASIEMPLKEFFENSEFDCEIKKSRNNFLILITKRINNEKYFFEIDESKCEKLSSALENKTVSTGDEINKLFSPFMTEVFTNEKYVNNMDAVKVLKRM